MERVIDQQRAQRIDRWLGRHRFGGHSHAHRRRPRDRVRHRFRWADLRRDPPPSAARGAVSGNHVPGAPAGRLTADPVHDYLRQLRGHPLLDAAGEAELAQCIEAGLVAEHRLTTGSPPPDLRAELEQLAAAGRRARDRLVTANLRLVVSVAKRYQHRGLELLDLVQEVNLGLIRAAERYDHTKGTRFAVYATWWIRQGIARAIADKARTVRVPSYLHETMARVRPHIAALERAGQSWTPASVAADLGIGERRVARSLACDRLRRVPLHQLTDDAAGRSADDFTVRIDAGVDVAAMLGAVRAGLGARAESILVLRFGLDGDGPRSLQEVGAVHGISRERVRQIEKRVLDFLRARNPAG